MSMDKQIDDKMLQPKRSSVRVVEAGKLRNGDLLQGAPKKFMTYTDVASQQNTFQAIQNHAKNKSVSNLAQTPENKTNEDKEYSFKITHFFSEEKDANLEANVS